MLPNCEVVDQILEGVDGHYVFQERCVPLQKANLKHHVFEHQQGGT